MDNHLGDHPVIKAWDHKTLINLKYDQGRLEINDDANLPKKEEEERFKD
jgi:hypothetical protein